MNAKRRRKVTPKPETDLFGEPVRPTSPRCKPIPRRDGPGWRVGVREPGRTIYVALPGYYLSEGEAWQAIREGVGAEPREEREEMRLEVRFSVRRGLL